MNVLIRDFDATLAHRKDKMWASALLDVAREGIPGCTLQASDLQQFLQADVASAEAAGILATLVHTQDGGLKHVCPTLEDVELFLARDQ